MRIAEELSNEKKAFQKRVRDHATANMNFFQKSMKLAGEVLDAQRHAYLSFDISAPLQTALSGFAHPLQLGKAVGKGVKAFALSLYSDKYAHQLEQQIKDNPFYKDGTFDRMKLELGDIEAPLGRKLKEENMESAFDRLADLQTNWAGMPDIYKGLIGMKGKQLIKGIGGLAKSPIKVVARGIKSSSVAFQTVANHMRIVSAEAGLRNFEALNGVRHSIEKYLRMKTASALLKFWFPDGKATNAQLEILGQLANTATGKGGLKNNKIANRVFFAPNYYLSIVRGLTAWDVWHPALKKKAPQGGTREGYVKAATANAIEFIRAVGTVALVTSLAWMFSDEDKFSLDPRSVNFGQFTHGDGTRTDLTFGRASWINAAAQWLSGEKVDENGKVSNIARSVVAGRFAEGRFAMPYKTASKAFDFAQDGGKPMTGGQFAKDMFVPLGMQQFEKLLEKEGIPMGTFLQMLSLVGVTSRVKREEKGSSVLGSGTNTGVPKRRELIGDLGL
jgi:hypothetical protein